MFQTKYLSPISKIVAVVVVLVGTAHIINPDWDVLYHEDGVLEYITVGVWFLSVLTAIGALIKFTQPGSRLLAFWTGWLALLAALRELDLHIWLNPKHLGEYGVRYRIDWWLGAEASIWLRLSWALFFVMLAGLTLYPLFRLLKRLLILLWRGDDLVGFLTVSVIFLFIGFVIDDILRPVHSVTTGTKQLFEETSEAIGALLYFIAMAMHWGCSLDARLNNSSAQSRTGGN